MLAQQASPPRAFAFPDTTLTVKLKFSSLFITLGHGWLWKVPAVQVCCKVPLPHYELVAVGTLGGVRALGLPCKGLGGVLPPGLPVLGLREGNVLGREYCQGLSGVWGSPIHADILG